MFDGKYFGTALKLSIAGESHSQYIEFSLRGMPPGFMVDFDGLRKFMQRRAPGKNVLSTSRSELDEVEFLTGIDLNGVTTGGVIKARIANLDARPSDYNSVRSIPRPGHADFGQWAANGFISSGGGTNSGRMTAALCAAGWLAITYLKANKIEVAAKVKSICGKDCDFENTILKAASEGDSVGGTIVCKATGLAPGIGGALFSGFESRLSAAIFAIPGVKGIEFGNGFDATSLLGSENNDEFVVEEGRVATSTNRHGGLLGGRTTGMPVVLTIAMKPTPTIFKDQQSVDLLTMKGALCRVKGRHDPCIVIRAAPVVEAVTALVAADMILERRAKNPPICLTLTSPDISGCVDEFNSQYPFVEMAEIRADLLCDSERDKVAILAQKLKVPTILTFRRKSDGGAFEGSDEERKSFFIRMLGAKAPFEFVDFEDDFRDEELESAAKAAGVRIIRSMHLFDAKKKFDIINEARRIRGVGLEIPKIAYVVDSESEVEAFFKATENFNEFEHIFCIMGNVGVRTRVEARRSNSMLVYASAGGLGEKIGHLSAHELVKRRYQLSEGAMK